MITPQDVVEAAQDAEEAARIAAEEAARAAAEALQREIERTIRTLQSNYNYLNDSYVKVRENKASIVHEIDDAINLANDIKGQISTYTHSSNVGGSECSAAIDNIISELQFIRSIVNY